MIFHQVTPTPDARRRERGPGGQQYAHAVELGRFELAAAERLSSGIRTEDAFKFMRKKLGLRAVDLAELLDVTAETVSRWETGKPEARAFALLGSMVAERMRGQEETVERLRASAIAAQATCPRAGEGGIADRLSTEAEARE